MKRTILKLMLVCTFSVIVSCGESGEEGVKQDFSRSTDEVLQHNVYFYLTDSITEAEKNEFEKGIQKLLSIKEISNSQVGVTGTTKSREVTDHNFDYSLFIWFESMEDYRIYADHPVHMEFIENYKQLWTEVKVYDSKLISLPEN